MSRKKDRKIRQLKIKDAGSIMAVKLQDMKLKDLKRAVVVLGMPFEQVVDSSIPALEGYYLRNYGAKIDATLLDKFDEWLEGYLETERGLGKEYFHPMLRLGYISTQDEETGEIKRRKIKGYRRVREKRTKNEFGIFSGTKKALTFKLAKEGITKKEAIGKVIEQFPDAKEKSIGIWYNKAIKGMA